jgi:hypothetical protein
MDGSEDTRGRREMPDIKILSAKSHVNVDSHMSLSARHSESARGGDDILA